MLKKSKNLIKKTVIANLTAAETLVSCAIGTMIAIPVGVADVVIDDVKTTVDVCKGNYKSVKNKFKEIDKA